LDERAAATAFALIVVGSLVFDASHGSFWQRSHDIAPFAAVLTLVFLVALLRRHGWAWWVFLIVSVVGLVTWVAHGKELTLGGVVGLLIGIAELALLLSAPMRRYVRA
jgi:hypothetical protein